MENEPSSSLKERNGAYRKQVKWYKSISLQIPVTILSVIMIAFLVVFNYYYSALVDGVIGHSSRVSISNLKVVARGIEGVTNEVEQFARKCGKDAVLAENLRKYINSSGVEKQVARSNITILLNQEILMNRNIESLYIMIEGSDHMITNLKGSKELPVNEGGGKMLYDRYCIELAGLSTWFKFADFYDPTKEVMSYSYCIPLADDLPRCSLICNTKPSRFSQLISESNSGGSYVVVCDYSGKVLLRSEGDIQVASIDEDPAFAPAFQSLKLTGSYGTKKGNIPLLAAYYRSGLTFWWYFQMIPRSYIISSISSQIMMMVSILGICIIVALLGAAIISQRIVRPLKVLMSGMKKAENGELLPIGGPGKSDNEIGILEDGFNIMVMKLKNLINEVYVQEIVRRKAQLNAIQSQLDEHFLYNTLNSIIYAANAEHAWQTSEMISMLSRYLRINLSEGKSLVKVSQVVELINGYLYIQKKRFGERIDATMRVQPELRDKYVLKHIFQPIVENAVVHGVEGRIDNVRIDVVLEKRANLLFFQVKDDGIGMREERLSQLLSSIESPLRVEGMDFALKNINAQIALSYGSEFGLSIESVYSKGTSVSFLIPWKDSDKDEANG